MGTKIKAICIDCDGVLTNGDILFFDDGITTARSFSTLDGHGFRLLREHGIHVHILTGSDSQSIEARARWLEVPVTTSQDKAHWIQMYSEYMDIPLENICVMGNDVIDLEVMKLVGLPACPIDAQDDVLGLCYNKDNGFISSKKGGKGAFREVCDFLISRNFVV